MNSKLVKTFCKDFIKEVKNYEYIIIFHHVRPDGDCLGSQQGLKKWLQLKFPSKKIYALGSNDGLFNFLKFSFDEIPSSEILDKAIGIIVDANYMNRINQSDIIPHLKSTIRIDHHPEKDDLPNCNLRFVDSSYCSSSEQIANIIYHVDRKSINKEIAAFLYLGIYTDSGRFFYDYISDRTHFLTSWLFETKFDFFSLHKNLSKRTLDEIKFNQHVLSNYKTHKNVIYYFVSQATIKKLKIKDSASNRVDFLANIDGYDIWIFFIENEDKSIRVRLRSSEKDISVLARQYNGGGHKKASGAIIYNKKDIEEIVKKAAKLK